MSIWVVTSGVRYEGQLLVVVLEKCPTIEELEETYDFAYADYAHVFEMEIGKVEAISSHSYDVVTEGNKFYLKR